MRKEFLYQQKKLSYQLSGNGPVVVLVHGFGEDGRIWTHQQAYLQDAFTVLIPDLPGSGSSEQIMDVSMESLADSLYALLNAENIDKCTLIGHSMGGYCTLAFVEKYPDKIEAFGLFHSTAFADTEEKKETRKKGIEFIKQHGAFEFLKTTTPNLFSSYTKATQPQLLEEHLTHIEYFSANALIAYYQAMIERPDRTAVLKQNKNPILFVLGKTDAAVPLQDGLQQSYMPDQSYVYILEQSAHMGMLEETEKANQFIKSFLLKTF